MWLMKYGMNIKEDMAQTGYAIKVNREEFKR
jgi:hypothetical protein